MKYLKQSRLACAIGAFLALAISAGPAAAQGVTTASVTGVVKDAQGGIVPGATVLAVHEPSGSTYEAVTQPDGRFFIPGMRVGGPYKVSAALAGFRTEEKSNVTLSLGVTQDLEFALQPAAVSETITVFAESNPVFSSTQTGASTAITREDLGVAADDFGTPHRHHPDLAAVRWQRRVRRPGQPDEQHHDRRVVFQRHVRSRHDDRRPGRSDERRADLA